MPASEKFQEWGLVKPKLYDGETYEKESIIEPVYDMTDIENIKKISNISNIKKYVKDGITDVKNDISEMKEEIKENIENAELDD